MIGRGDDAVAYTWDPWPSGQTILTLTKKANAWWVVKREVWKQPEPAKN